MTEQNPNQPSSEGPEIDLDALRKSVSEEINVYVNEAKSNPRKVRVALFSLAITTGITYYAAKKGAASALKGASKIQEEFLTIAEMAAQDASKYAYIAEQNAQVSHELHREIGGAISELSKAVKAVAKKR